MSLRVLHVIPSISPRHGGPSVALPLITQAAARQGARITVATSDDDGPGARLDVPLEKFVPGPGGADYIYFRRNIEFYKISRGLSRWLWRHVGDYDVVHIHALFSFSSFAAARAARRAGVPYIVRPLGVLNQWGLENRRRFVKRWSLKMIELPILRGAACIHYTAEAERREAALAHPEIASMRSEIIPIPVEAGPVMDPNEIHVRFPMTVDRRVILFLSRLDQKKGIELLLSAFQEIRPEFPDALLVIAGSGEKSYVESLHEQARSLGCEADTAWPGFVTGDDKAALLAGATLFVLPSYSENFGIAAAEALSAGVPSILSEHVALAQEKNAAQAAVIVPCDSGAIAEATRRLLRDSSLRDSLATRGRAFVHERFSPDAIGRELSELYKRVIEPGSGSARRSL
jgi:glycosyltransferase involved in cell wall biosynthesis